MSKTFEYFFLKILVFFLYRYTNIPTEEANRLNLDLNSAYGNSNSYDME